jgi:hypothetical protein
MILKLILKKISIKNGDVDSYASLTFDLALDKHTDINYLHSLHHKVIEIDTEKIKVKR